MNDREAVKQLQAICRQGVDRNIALISQFLLDFVIEGRLKLVRMLLDEINFEFEFSILEHMSELCFNRKQVEVARKLIEFANDPTDQLLLLSELMVHTGHPRDMETVRALCEHEVDKKANVIVRLQIYRVSHGREDLELLQTAILRCDDAELATNIYSELLEQDVCIGVIVATLKLVHDDQFKRHESCTVYITELIERTINAVIHRRDPMLILEVAEEVPFQNPREQLLEVAILKWHGHDTFGIN